MHLSPPCSEMLIAVAGEQVPSFDLRARHLFPPTGCVDLDHGITRPNPHPSSVDTVYIKNACAKKHAPLDACLPHAMFRMLGASTVSISRGECSTVYKTAWFRSPKDD